MVAQVSDKTFAQLLKLKAEQVGQSSSWKEWLEYLVRNVDLDPTISQQVRKGTRELLPMWCQNFSENLPLIRQGKTLRDLAVQEIPKPPNDRCIVVGRGPSLYRNNHLKMLAESEYEGIVLATDGALIDCLKEGIIPEFVMTVDGSPVCEKWYNDSLVDESGSKIRVVMATQASPKTVARALKANMSLYWFQPTLDDIRDQPSITKAFMLMTCSETNPDGVVSQDVGGNCGTGLFVFAWSVLKRSNIALIGLDFGYPEDMPLNETYYWNQTVDHIGALRTDTLYETIWHPYFKTKSKIDMVFKCYRETLLDMLLAIPDWVKMVSCVEGGTLFHPRMEYKKFKDWLTEK